MTGLESAHPARIANTSIHCTVVTGAFDFSVIEPPPRSVPTVGAKPSLVQPVARVFYDSSRPDSRRVTRERIARARHRCAPPRPAGAEDRAGGRTPSDVSGAQR